MTFAEPSLQMVCTLTAQPREKILINNDCTFALGHAGDMEKVFSRGMGYFTYLTKAASSKVVRGGDNNGSGS